MPDLWFKCSKECGEIVSIDLDNSNVYEVDVRNNRVTSVEHTIKRCDELIRCRKGLKPLPVGQTTLKLFEDCL